MGIALSASIVCWIVDWRAGGEDCVGTTVFGTYIQTYMDVYLHANEMMTRLIYIYCFKSYIRTG